MDLAVLDNRTAGRFRRRQWGAEWPLWENFHSPTSTEFWSFSVDHRQL